MENKYIPKFDDENIIFILMSIARIAQKRWKLKRQHRANQLDCE